MLADPQLTRYARFTLNRRVRYQPLVAGNALNRQN